MAFNSYNRAPGPEFDSTERDRVAVSNAGDLEKAGCALAYVGGSLECLGSSGPIGAVLPNGNRFDLSLPFGFSFTRVVAR